MRVCLIKNEGPCPGVPSSPVGSVEKDRVLSQLELPKVRVGKVYVSQRSQYPM